MTALEMRSISKAFPGTLAVNMVDFDVRPGEVHALLGENGAGKSTLMKILAGSYDDYTGEILINREKVRLDTPAKAIDHGVGMIYQELSLAEPISIAENILVGRLPKKGKIRIDRKGMIRESRENLIRVGLADLDPLQPVSHLSRHEAQLVEIAKVLGNNPSILVMDEPTSALSREEIRTLFSIIESLKKQGLAIVYISHRLPEIFRIADRVTILRDGKKILTSDIHEMTSSTLAAVMIGKDPQEYVKNPSSRQKGNILEVMGLSRNGFFHNISLSASSGEILGIAGLSGAGRSELGRSLCGLDPSDEGEILLKGKTVPRGNYRKIINRGMIYLSEDRKTDGLFASLKVGSNILSTVIDKSCRAGIYDKNRYALRLRNLIEKLKITPPREDAPVRTLSGGNQQKVFLAKWLAADPDILILDEPTKGVDVGARSGIHTAIGELAERGKTILLISSDLTELVNLSDRVLVMRNGAIIDELAREQLTEEAVLLAANGEGVY